MQPDAVNSLACPQCGGQNAFASGSPFLTCDFCDATLVVDRSALLHHYRLPRLLDEEKAAAALRRWMAGNETVKDLDRHAELVENRPVSFPMWLFRLRTGGGEHVRVEPAAPTPVPQLADLNVPAGQLEAYRPEEEVETILPSVPLATAREWLGEAAQTVTESALVEIPLWRCRYRFGDEEYIALVEGSTGSVMASVFPAKKEQPYYAVGCLGFAAFLLTGLVIVNPFFKLLAFGVLAVPLGLMAFGVARRV